MNTQWIRVVYGAALAALVAATVILGIQLISPGPRPPAPLDVNPEQILAQSSDSQSSDTGNGSQEQVVAATTRFFNDATTYRERVPGYRRNVTLAAMGAGMMVVLAGLGLPQIMNHVRGGLVAGSLLLLGYGYIISARAIPGVPINGAFPISLLTAGAPGPLNTSGRLLLFVVPFVGLILMLFVGLWRLTPWSPRRAPPPLPRPVEHTP